MMIVHDMGALLFFVCGVVYTILQTVISFKAHPFGASKSVCYIRGIFALVALLAAFPSILYLFTVAGLNGKQMF